MAAGRDYNHYTDSIERAIKNTLGAPVTNLLPTCPAPTLNNAAHQLQSAITTQAPLPVHPVKAVPSSTSVAPIQNPQLPNMIHKNFAGNSALPSIHQQPYVPVTRINVNNGVNGGQPSYQSIVTAPLYNLNAIPPSTSINFNGAMPTTYPLPMVNSVFNGAMPTIYPFPMMNAVPPATFAIPSTVSVRKVYTGTTYNPPVGILIPGLDDAPAPTASANGNPAPVILPHKVKPQPPVPPNWEKCYNDALHILAPYTTTPVQKNSWEYGTLAAMVEPQLTVSGINRIVNPELWKKFLQTRKEMMSRKSEDLGLLGGLGLPEEELILRTHVSMNFVKDTGVAGVDYSDNVALLFHGTRGKVEPILNQGLDERLGSATGMLGRGIYFADDPLKSVNYDLNSTLLVFAVLLGDCLNVSNLPNVQGFVREPAKVDEQKRNHTDQFFDSIVGRPAGVNEFVIYDRNRCCPLYTINYARSASMAKQDDYARNRGTIPPFAWSPITTYATTKTGKKGKGTTSTISLPPPGNMIWPFFAQTIFAQMGGDEEKSKDSTMGAAGGSDEKMEQDWPDVVDIDVDPREESIVMKLSYLWELGFKDDENNMVLLKKLNYDLEKTVDSLLQGNFSNPQPPAATTTAQVPPPKLRRMDKAGPSRSRSTASVGHGNSNGRPTATATATATLSSAAAAGVDDDDEDCPICCVDSRGKWRTLKCSHKVCEACHLQLEKTRTTMSGQSHTFVKCPFCQACSGLEIGSCPTGTMTVAMTPGSVDAYEGYNTHSIHYIVPGTPGVNRMAYIPASDEGSKVVALLQIAWDRRLCFSVGTSVTTGAQNVLVWNIHHKTAMTRGIQAYGYPDPTYLTRVQQELAQYGIE